MNKIAKSKNRKAKKRRPPRQEAEPPPPPRDNRLLYFLLFVAVLALSAYAYLQIWGPANNGTGLLEEAELALGNGNFIEAERLALEAHRQNNKLDRAMLVAGQAAAGQRNFLDAIRHFKKVRQDGDIEAVTALWAAGDSLGALGRIWEAEQSYRQALRVDPNHLPSMSRLAAVLGATGRRWESRDYLVQLAKERKLGVEELLHISELHTTMDSRKMLFPLMRQQRDDPAIDLGLARLGHNFHEVERAKGLALRVLARTPQEIEAHLILGKIYLTEGFPNGLTHWKNNLPAGWQGHPDAWLVIGTYYENLGVSKVAARCYWEALRLDPNHKPVASRLARVLQQERYNPVAIEQFSRHSRGLIELATAIDDLEGKGPTPQAFVRVINQLESLGRMWEAVGWYQIAAQRYGDQMDSEILQRIEARLWDNPPLVRVEVNPAENHDLSRFPLPDWNNVPTQIAGLSPDATRNAGVQLRDVAKEVGLDFEYKNGVQWRQMNQNTVYYIFQVTGGGIGVLDYDLDGWPDMYVSQGTAHPNQIDDRQPGDRLFRNLGNGQFEDVTEQTLLGDRRFSQGVSCGDFNNDGFPDIYVCNFGRDTLYQNQGDGTFRDITDRAGLQIPSWSTSAAMADLNGDRLPDLYISSYVEGDEVFEPCRDVSQQSRSCHPRKLPAASDHVYLNQGDGRFREVTQTNGFTVPPGRGLGVVVGHLENSDQAVVFVANDTTENFYFEPNGPNQANFQETATLKGVASDRDGVLQACMGVAVDDADGDGLMDIYVTNFQGESNAFYHQVDAGLFIDEASRFGLRQSSLSMLGFGTQFFDSNLDGWPDLFVANGHIDDLRHKGHEFQMRPQLLFNTGQQRFAELEPQQVGEYFAARYLGRAAALIDWNRDGKQDVVVQHLDHPLSLLSNESSTANRHWVALKLTGTASSRDGFGAIVDIELEDRTIHKHLVAGSGYYVSNQRLISTGLGEADHIKQIVVRWPSGQVDRWSDISVDQTYHLVEGNGELIPVGR